eukprot:m.462201 g.462201  ORF g.462201 m.462201 type:complete len:67 (+) comp20349_c0_seq5:1944-2144(+)
MSLRSIDTCSRPRLVDLLRPDSYAVKHDQQLDVAAVPGQQTAQSVPHKSTEALPVDTSHRATAQHW